jgi:tetratricopeptide (TPR) repeat protein
VAIKNATVFELHQYGKELLAQNKKDEAFQIFELNFKNSNGIWPTTAGMMRMHSALQNYPKALEFAKKAFAQAPDELNKNALEAFILILQEGKHIN